MSQFYPEFIRDLQARLDGRPIYGVLETLCGGDSTRLEEAKADGVRAVEARLAFWDGILAALPSRLKKVA